MWTHPHWRWVWGVSQSKVSHLFDVNIVVEVDQVSSLFFTITCTRGRWLLDGRVGGCGGGTAGLGRWQGAAAANRNWTNVYTCWWETRRDKEIQQHTVKPKLGAERVSEASQRLRILCWFVTNTKFNLIGWKHRWTYLAPAQWMRSVCCCQSDVASAQRSTHSCKPGAHKHRKANSLMQYFRNVTAN